MSNKAFSEVDIWIFDLDNTLYPADCHLFAQIDARMASFIEERLDCDPHHARYLQKDWYAKHGTTLAGLMIEHDVPPHDFLDYVHDIDLSPLDENAPLRTAIESLPGQKYIFTNGTRQHAENVTSAIGISDLFHDVFDIAAGDFTPKPHAPAYDAFMGRFGVNPQRSAFFEDMPHNLAVPYESGMTTVLVQSEASWFDDEPNDKRPSKPGETYSFVHHVTTDLTLFLGELTSSGSNDGDNDT